MTDLAKITAVKIQNAHVLVTGAAKRVGREIALALQARGAKVTAHYHRSQAEAQSLAGMTLVQADLGDEKQIKELVTKVLAVAPLDILINCASIFYPVKTLEVSSQTWDEFQLLNLKSPFLLSQAFYSSLKARRGCLINIVDTNATHPLPNFAPYNAAKAGLRQLTQQLAKEWAPDIRVNSVSPGTVLMPEGHSEAALERAKERTWMKRVGTPQDVANAVLFLIENDYLTGFDLKVDGGM